jgi:hypothetical protein
LEFCFDYVYGSMEGMPIAICLTCGYPFAKEHSVIEKNSLRLDEPSTIRYCKCRPVAKVCNNVIANMQALENSFAVIADRTPTTAYTNTNFDGTDIRFETEFEIRLDRAESQRVCVSIEMSLGINIRKRLAQEPESKEVSVLKYNRGSPRGSFIHRTSFMCSNILVLKSLAMRGNVKPIIKPNRYEFLCALAMGNLNAFVWALSLSTSHSLCKPRPLRLPFTHCLSV